MRDMKKAPEPPRGTEGCFSGIRKADTVKTVLLLGSGALKIGEAGEFDYSGSQAIKAFKEEGKRVILVNPNIATNQTSWGLADAVYFVPVTPSFVERVVEKEQPDAIALSFGGQTALNCGVRLEELGVLQKYGLNVLGTPVESIRKTEDRALFNKELMSIGIDVPRSEPCETIPSALEAADKIGYPVIVRGAFALGGKGSGRALNQDELKELLKVAFVESPQVLVEEDLTGWKEIEYEVVRDAYDNCITVCNMENVDPLGIHTGESIVIAPSQTLDNFEYQMLRSIALKVIRHFGIVGECNIQYALDPRSRSYRVIEVNARLSRSSALASKATGYPLAFVAAKLALGHCLPELRNAITEVTSADFEPSLDYVAVKMPRWDLQKFRHVSNQVTSEMKSIGEVMGLGRTFEEALQNAVRMLNIGAEGLYPCAFKFEDLTKEVKRPTPRRIFAVAEALGGEWTVDEMNIATGIDRWFLERIRSCADIAQELFTTKAGSLQKELLRRAKRSGFSDKAIGQIRDEETEEIRTKRIQEGITPFVKQIDTLAGEFPRKRTICISHITGRSMMSRSKLRRRIEDKGKRTEERSPVLRPRPSSSCDCPRRRPLQHRLLGGIRLVLRAGGARTVPSGIFRDDDQQQPRDREHGLRRMRYAVLRSTHGGTRPRHRRSSQARGRRRLHGRTDSEFPLPETRRERHPHSRDGSREYRPRGGSAQIQHAPRRAHRGSARVERICGSRFPPGHLPRASGIPSLCAPATCSREPPWRSCIPASTSRHSSNRRLS